MDADVEMQRENEMQREEDEMDEMLARHLCDEWRLPMNARCLGVVKVAREWLEDWKLGKIEEERARAIFEFYYDLAELPFDVAPEKVHEAASMIERQDPDQPYTLLVTHTGLINKPYWPQLKAAVDEMVEFEVALDGETDRAELLICVLRDLHYADWRYRQDLN